MSTYEVLWYSGGSDHAPNRVIGRDHLRRRDLHAAIVSAANMLKAGKGQGEGLARGFYVRPVREEGSACH